MKEGKVFKTVLIVVLVILVLTMGAYIAYDKLVLNKKISDQKDTTGKTTNIPEVEKAGTVTVKTVYGKEYVIGGKTERISMEQPVFNIKGDYAKSLNDKYDKQVKEHIKKVEESIYTKEYLDSTGLNEIFKPGIPYSTRKVSVIENNVYRDIASILISTTYAEMPGEGRIENNTENINVKTGARVSNLELLSLYNISIDSFNTKIESIIDGIVANGGIEEDILTETDIEKYNLYINEKNELYVCINQVLAEPQNQKISQ